MGEPIIRALIVDDESGFCHAIAAYLEDMGLTASRAYDGRRGLELFRAERPDIVLLDLRMPEVDGLEVLQTVVAESPETPVVIVSGTGVIGDAVEALRLGAWDYILKPIQDMKVLEHAVEKVLERARLLRENRRYQEHLEQQVQERTRGLASAKQALEKAAAERERLIVELEARNAELQRFVYTVSHDLRSPLITISGFADVLAQDAARGNREALHDDLTHIRTAAAKMHRLLDDLLELARVGRVVNPPEAVALGELAQEAVALVAGRLSARGVAVQIAPDLPTVRGDRPRLLEVFQNLVDNAAKFMGDQQNPRIEIGMRKGKGVPVVFVRDNGCGIEARYHDTVFGLFNRLDTSQDGSGVGLTITKRIIESHGGRIWVESEGAGQGSTFCFSLAAPPDDAKPSSARPHGE